jgi:RNA-directed DNA polymerase
MTDQPRSRQDIWDRIRSTSREEVIFQEMVRLGFWPAFQPKDRDPPEEVQRRREIEQELASLRSESRRLHDEVALRREMRKRRLGESRRKRQETKERHERERQERAERWRQRKQKEVLFLGAGVSGGLGQTLCDEPRLQTQGLPVLHSAEEIAAALGLSAGALRFLAFARKTSPVSHYVRFTIPKKPTGERLISAPKPRLKAAQRWILEQVLAKLDLHDAAHGFRPGRSIVTNARPHVGAQIVVNVDLKDFFPSIAYRRVRGLFRVLGYSEAAATVLGLLCTEPEVEQVELDGQSWFVALGPRHLPQGAPTSPAISNLLCRRLDRRLSTVATKLGFTYTRYADDLSFSSSGAESRDVGRLLRRVGFVVAREGFEVHPAKTRILRSSRRQEVTGVVVNRRPAIPRKTLRRFRATLFQIEKDGPAGKHWGACPEVIASVRGFANFVAMVDPEAGARLQERVRRLVERYGIRSQPRRKAAQAKGPEAAGGPAPAQPGQAGASLPPPGLGEAGAEKKGKPWWKLW